MEEVLFEKTHLPSIKSYGESFALREPRDPLQMIEPWPTLLHFSDRLLLWYVKTDNHVIVRWVGVWKRQSWAEGTRSRY